MKGNKSQSNDVFQKALAVCLKRKPINQITIKELVKEANYNRGSFYYHYADIYDLLEKTEQKLYLQLKEIVESEVSKKFNPDAMPLIEKVLTFIDDNADIFAALLGTNGDIQFKKQIANCVYSCSHQNWENEFSPENYIYVIYSHRFTIGGVIEVIEKWLNDERPFSYQELSSYIESMIIDNVKKTESLKKK